MGKIITSFVLPCFNEAANPLLVKTIRSILTQELVNYSELIIIDDGSTDGSVKKIIPLLNKEKSGLKYQIISNETNLGIAVALNEGIKRAKGKYILRIDCGDIALPGRAKRQVDYMEKNDDIDLMGGLTKWIDSYGNIFSEYAFNKKIKSMGLNFKTEILYKNYLVHSTWIIRKELFDKIGYYDPTYVLEDYELLVRAVSRGYKVVILPEYYTLIYKNQTGLSGFANKKEIQQSLFLIKKKYLRQLFGFKNVIGLLKSSVGYFFLKIIFYIHPNLRNA